MRRFSSEVQSKTAELIKPFSFTKGCPVLKIDKHDGIAQRLWNESEEAPRWYKTLLFDLKNDPEQKMPIEDSQAEQIMIGYMARLMKENGAPPEQHERLGLPTNVT